MKYGFLFGAGAEFDYGMPSGGEFALDLFFTDTEDVKSEFKKMRDYVDSDYAKAWFPKNFKKSRISRYGKSEFEAIIKDTIEHNRRYIIEKLNHLDKTAESIVEDIKKEKGKSVDEAFKNIMGCEVQNTSVNQDISFTNVFKDGNELFKNHYFSSLLQVYLQKTKTDTGSKVELRTELKKILISIFQLQIGALGEKLSREISDNLFSKKIEDIDIFDDLGELFQLDYRYTGISGLEYLIDYRQINISNTSNDEEVILYFVQKLFREIFDSVLDYKTLIDSNWHFLYYPREQWAKFCKISNFLLKAREIINEKYENRNKDTRGYYDELIDAIESKKFEITAISTTNYTKLITDIIGENVIFLNGSTELWYDPYINKIGKKEKLNKKHILVPLMFTQNGTKPMTSIEMSIKYVDMYNKFKDSDYICVVGFGFNPDDAHINSILRTLVEDNDKKTIVVYLKKDKSDSEVKEEILNKLKVAKKDNVQVLQVNANREKDGENWIEQILKMTT